VTENIGTTVLVGAWLARLTAGISLRTLAVPVDIVRGLLPGLAGAAPADEGPAPALPDATIASLRARGAELLRQSADVRYEQDTHPAYERILDDLTPDEARILRLLMLEGAQPAVDVRGGKVPIVGSQLPAPAFSMLVAPGLSMIGAHAGCRYRDRVPAYLNNLGRLGLVWFSREQLDDPLRYQVLEAQPDVIQALKEAGRGRTVRRSVQLTPFGEDFCRVCFPL
jgi:hypothetical protein